MKAAESHFYNSTDDSQLHDIFSNLSDYIVVLDKDWKFRFINFNYDIIRPGVNPLGKGLFDLHPDLDDSPFGQCCRNVMQSRQSDSISGYFKAVDHWVKAKVFPISDGGVGLAVQLNT